MTLNMTEPTLLSGESPLLVWTSIFGAFDIVTKTFSTMERTLLAATLTALEGEDISAMIGNNNRDSTLEQAASFTDKFSTNGFQRIDSQSTENTYITFLCKKKENKRKQVVIAGHTKLKGINQLL